jgi:hypothetical protein
VVGVMVMTDVAIMMGAVLTTLSVTAVILVCVFFVTLMMTGPLFAHVAVRWPRDRSR